MIYDMISFYDGTGTYSYMYWSTGVLTVPRYFGTVDCGLWVHGWMDGDDVIYIYIYIYI